VIVTFEIAKEIGEAMLDASESTKIKGVGHSVILLNDLGIAVSVETDDLLYHDSYTVVASVVT